MFQALTILEKPRILISGKIRNTTGSHNMNQEELEAWRSGMKAMMAIPHVLGYRQGGVCDPSAWTWLIPSMDPLLGTDRCMAALNWWKDGTADPVMAE
jgi:hypothetical protein